jgi:hypothetical protein
MEVWQRYWSLKISCDFTVLGRVMRNKRRFLVAASWEGDQQEIVNCLTLTTSNPRVTSPSEISCAELLTDR